MTPSRVICVMVVNFTIAVPSPRRRPLWAASPPATNLNVPIRHHFADFLRKLLGAAETDLAGREQLGDGLSQ
jgi:hypothetical protein